MKRQSEYEFWVKPANFAESVTCPDCKVFRSFRNHFPGLNSSLGPLKVQVIPNLPLSRTFEIVETGLLGLLLDA